MHLFVIIEAENHVGSERALRYIHSLITRSR